MRKRELYARPVVKDDISQHGNTDDDDTKRGDEHEQHRFKYVEWLANSKQHNKPRKGEREHHQRVVFVGGNAHDVAEAERTAGVGKSDDKHR